MLPVSLLLLSNILYWFSWLKSIFPQPHFKSLPSLHWFITALKLSKTFFALSSSSCSTFCFSESSSPNPIFLSNGSVTSANTFFICPGKIPNINNAVMDITSMATRRLIFPCFDFILNKRQDIFYSFPYTPAYFS